jgi:hypothetical protein
MCGITRIEYREKEIGVGERLNHCRFGRP